MISLFRIAAVMLGLAAACAMIWCGLSYWQVIEGWIATGSIIIGVIIAILTVQFGPTLFAGPYVEPEPAKQRRQVKHRAFKIFCNIASFLLLAGFSYAAITFGLDVRGVWESWFSTTCVIAGAVAAILAFVPLYKV